MHWRRAIGGALVAGLVVAGCAGGGGRSSLSRAGPADPVPPPAERDLDSYRGLGAWIDVFDFAPAYQDPGQSPAVTAEAVDILDRYGVDTIYLQAARLDPRSPEGIVDTELVGELLARARRAGMRVVGWYLPKFADLDADVARVEAIRRFAYQGHRFDGVALDIEWRQDVPDHAERNVRLVELSRRLRDLAGDEALGAIVPPPVLLEVVNRDNWPDFPWPELAGLYDVWLPMSYWTLRTAASGYRDGYAYTEENIRRMRANLGDPDAAVHPIGGVADEATAESYRGFVRAADEAGSVGLSVYDYVTTLGDGWNVLTEATGGS
ncbi:MAG TPA: hypothetical protein VNT56_06580 [Acidimicrobiales bacterium]|nr:hypothetical protein [Acidimicrobiales bacterium]